MKQKIIDMFNAIDSNRHDDLRKIYTFDAIYERPGYPEIVGYSGIHDFYKSIRIIDSGIHNIDGIIEGDGFCCCWGQFNGTSKFGGKLSERFCDIYRLEGGLIKLRITHFFRPAI
jgi:hypothetical protein